MMRFWILVGLALAVGALWADLGDVAALLWPVMGIALVVAALAVLSYRVNEFYIPDLTAVMAVLLVLVQWMLLAPTLADELNGNASWDPIEIPARYFIVLLGQAILVFSAFANWVNWRLVEFRQER